MRVLDDEQRWLVGRRLVEGEDAQHREEFVVGVEVGLVPELAQRHLEQGGRVEPGAVHDGTFLVIVAQVDKVADQRRFAGQRRPLQQGEPVRRRAGGANSLQSLEMRGIGYN